MPFSGVTLVEYKKSMRRSATAIVWDAMRSVCLISLMANPQACTTDAMPERCCCLALALCTDVRVKKKTKNMKKKKKQKNLRFTAWMAATENEIAVCNAIACGWTRLTWPTRISSSILSWPVVTTVWNWVHYNVALIWKKTQEIQTAYWARNLLLNSDLPTYKHCLTPTHQDGNPSNMTALHHVCYSNPRITVKLNLESMLRTLIVLAESRQNVEKPVWE